MQEEVTAQPELVIGAALPQLTPELAWQLNFSENDGSVTWSLKTPTLSAIISGYPAQFSSWQALVEIGITGINPQISQETSLSFSQAHQFVMAHLRQVQFQKLEGKVQANPFQNTLPKPPWLE